MKKEQMKPYHQERITTDDLDQLNEELLKMREEWKRCGIHRVLY